MEKPWWPANAIVRTSPKRAQWTKYQGGMRPDRLISIDETWTKTDMAPFRGWAQRGARLTAKVPQGRWKTPTSLSALGHDLISAPVLDGLIDDESFSNSVAKVLIRP